MAHHDIVHSDVTVARQSQFNAELAKANKPEPIVHTVEELEGMLAEACQLLENGLNSRSEHDNSRLLIRASDKIKKWWRARKDSFLAEQSKKRNVALGKLTDEEKRLLNVK